MNNALVAIYPYSILSKKNFFGLAKITRSEKYKGFFQGIGGIFTTEVVNTRKLPIKIIQSIKAKLERLDEKSLKNRDFIVVGADFIDSSLKWKTTYFDSRGNTIFPVKEAFQDDYLFELTGESTKVSWYSILIDLYGPNDESDKWFFESVWNIPFEDIVSHLRQVHGCVVGDLYANNSSIRTHLESNLPKQYINNCVSIYKKLNNHEEFEHVKANI